MAWIAWIQKRKCGLFTWQGPLNCSIIMNAFVCQKCRMAFQLCVANICILNIWAQLMSYRALPLRCIITLHFRSLQKGIHIPGGLEKPMRSTTIGADQDLAFKNVPVASNATVLIPNTTATVMLIISNGEWFKIKQGENDQNLLIFTTLTLFWVSFVSLFPFLPKNKGKNIFFVIPPAKYLPFSSILFVVPVTVKYKEYIHVWKSIELQKRMLKLQSQVLIGKPSILAAAATLSPPYSAILQYSI